MTGRYEKERAGWVLARAGRNMVARRRGERLLMAARRGERSGVGVGDAAYAEVSTPDIVSRTIARGEGISGKLGWLVMGGFAALLFLLAFGPAWLVSRVAYLVWWLMVPRWGSMRSWPYLVGSVLPALVVAAAPHLPLENTLTVQWVGAQLGLGMLWAAWLVRSSGWAAVEVRESAHGDTIHAVHLSSAGDPPADVVVPEPEPEEPEEVEQEEIEGIAPIRIRSGEED